VADAAAAKAAAEEEDEVVDILTLDTGYFTVGRCRLTQ
jgi:hypothetical protein